MTERALVSGEQYAIAAGDYTADIASVGASLRSLRYRGRDLVLPFEAAELRPRFRGAVLAPWPNRVSGGRWTWNGRDLQLPITEPELGHAVHGLVAWADWSAVGHTDDGVTLTTNIAAQPGYPFQLRLTMTWSLTPEGLKGELRAVNDGVDVAPFGCAIHPYMVAPHGELDSWTLHVGAASELLVDAASIPTELVPVLDEHDFTSPRPIGTEVIDHAFTGFGFAHQTEAATVTDAHGDGARIVFGPGTPWLQICTSDWPDEPGHRAAVAVEPMTCPPNAFVTNDDLILIPAAGQHITSWWIEAVSSATTR